MGSIFSKTGKTRRAARWSRCALLAAACAAPLPVLVAGCGPRHQVKSVFRYSEEARKEYEQALEALEAKDWPTFERRMNEVRRKYAYSRYARLAALRLADAHHQQEKFAEAISGYKTFVHDYPNDPEVPYARYRVAKTQFDSVSQSVLLPPLEERDLAAVNDALNTIRGFMEDYPESNHGLELKYMFEVVVGMLARHELYVARFYLARDRFEAAADRIDYALRSFPDADVVPEALLLLGEVRLKQKQVAEASRVLSKLVEEYAESPFSVPARRYLTLLGGQEKRAQQSAP